MKRFFSLLILIFFCIADGAEFTDSAIVLLDDREYVTVNPDGSSTTSDQCVYKIVNYQGLLQMRKMSLHFSSDYGTLQVTSLAITKPDGRKIILDPQKNSTVSVDASQMASDIYDPSQKILNVTVPGLEVGDTLEVTTLENNTKSRMPGEWSDIAVLQGSFPIVNYEYTVDLPESKPLQGICIKDEVPGTITHTKSVKDGRIIYRWTAKNVPQAVPEPAMPAMYTCVQRILLSTVASWEDISKWYDRLCAAPLTRITPEMAAKTQELISGKTDDMDKIMALFQFVSQQIRYTGITDEDSAPGYEPHDVSKTFNQRHGVCRDKAALLVAMLRLAKFKAYPVLFMSGTPKDREVANIFFNHAVTAVELTDGEYILMDPTFETTTELFPGYLAGFPYLVAKPEGETLRLAPEVKAENNLLAINTDAVIHEKSVTVTSQLSFSGVYDQMYRHAFSTWTKEEMNSYFAGQLQKIIPGAILDQVKVTPADIRDMDQKLAVELTYSVPDALHSADTHQLFPVLRSGMNFGLLNSLYANTALKSRKFPLLALPRAIEENITIRCPDNTRLIMPQNITVNEPGLFRMNGNNSFDGKVLTEKFFFAIDTMKVAPENYAKFKKAAADARNMWQTPPVLAPQEPQKFKSDTEYLDFTKHYQVADNHSWQVTTHYIEKINNYAGLKKSANLNIPYTEGVETLEIHAAVTDSKGIKHTVSSKDINFMDDPASAGAPRYLKRKIAVVSFPGVDVNSTIECTVIRRTSQQPFFYAQMDMLGDIPAKKRELIVEHPAKMPLQIALSPGIKDASTMGGKNIIRRYYMENCPRIPEESGQVEYALFTPSVRISGGDYGKFYQEINAAAKAKAAEVSPEIAAQAKKIFEKISAIPLPKRHPEDKLMTASEVIRLHVAYDIEKYIYKHVRKNLLPLNNIRFSEYSLPQVTLREGYGNSIDRAILLAAMLKAVDIKYEFIPVSSWVCVEQRMEFLQKIPANVFTELLVYLPEFDVFLNDSGLYASAGFLRHGNNICLRDNGLSHVNTYSGTHSDITIIGCDLTLDEKLCAAVTLKYYFDARREEIENERFAKFTPALEKQYIEKLAAAISPNAEVQNWSFDAKREDEQLIITLQIPDFAKRTGKFVMLPLPEFRRFTEITAVPAKLPRMNPFAFKQEKSVSIFYDITVPENFRPIMSSKDDQVDFEAMSWQKSYEFDNGVHCFHLEASVFPAITVPGKFQRLRELNNEINHINTGNILFITESNQ